MASDESNSNSADGRTVNNTKSTSESAIPCEVCPATHETVPEHNDHMAEAHGEAVLVADGSGIERHPKEQMGAPEYEISEGVETDTKFVEFNAPEVSRCFRFMVTRFEPGRQSIPHGSGYVDHAYRQYVWIAMGDKLQVTDNDIYSLIEKIDELSRHNHRESEFWEFLKWFDRVSWARIPEEYRTGEGEWGEGE